MKIIDVPFSYEAVVRHKRKRNTSRHVYVATVPVEIAELTDAQAPIALRYQDHNYGEGDPVEMRWFEGHLWAQKMISTDDDTKIPADFGWLLGVNREFDQYGNPLSSHDCPKTGATTARIEDDVDIQEVHVSGRESIEAKIRDLAAEIVLIGGTLWERSKEPYLYLTTSGGYAWINVAKPFQQQAERLSFRLDQLGIIKQACAHDLRGIETITGPIVEILIPDALKKPCDEVALLASARNILDDMKKAIATQDVEFFIAYRDLREAMAAAERQLELNQAVDVTPLATAMRNGMSACNPGPDGEDGVCSTYMIRSAEAALSRIELSGAERSLSDIPSL
ncbi:hypothetical protein [Bosea sp. RAC05]|uniref:hypothetical protein n=1 Tax=Bosea sp. RAC05 TaxID=1842539 RepID=UPI00083CBFBA|nr:hypothetical protein [Bosea sp. RAC05]AOG02828.1 hypothetical protein BSY19_5368 [Bosea sp. RAC05]